MNLKLLLLLPVAAVIVFLSLFASSENKEMRRGAEKYEVALRLIGHQLLLSAGDDSSRVLPIRQLSEKKFQINFERAVSLEPDSIINIITRTANTHLLPDNYTLNVLNCSTADIEYSFVMSDVDSNTVIPCLGRNLPLGCYNIVIDFSQPAAAPSNKYYISFGVGALMLLIIGMVFYFKRRNARRTASISTDHHNIRIGNFVLYPELRRLEIRDERIELTDKESKLLNILASAQNEVVSREQLQKEVWENEGVIVTRSLDVFISKLRKKLEKDPGIRIVNVHGKGYKLQVHQ